MPPFSSLAFLSVGRKLGEKKMGQCCPSAPLECGVHPLPYLLNPLLFRKLSFGRALKDGRGGGGGHIGREVDGMHLSKERGGYADGDGAGSGDQNEPLRYFLGEHSRAPRGREGL